MLLWVAPMVIGALGGIDLAGRDHIYLIIGSFIIFDAIIPIFPSESLLTAAATLIAGGNSTMHLFPLIVTGAVAAIIGDSALFWLSRTFGRRYVSEHLERAERNEKFAAGMRVLGSNAPMLIVGGRFVPGVRFIVNATMGIGKIAYRRFLLWSAVGAWLWSAYTCLFTYLVGQALGDYPIISFATSALVTGLLLGVVAIPLKRRYARERDAGPVAQ